MACERCKKKKLLKNLKAKHLGTCVSEALKNNKVVMDVLCLMLEWMVVDDLHQRNQIVDTLKSTVFGKKVYDDFMSRQNQLLELVSINQMVLMTLPRVWCSNGLWPGGGLVTSISYKIWDVLKTDDLYEQK